MNKGKRNEIKKRGEKKEMNNGKNSFNIGPSLAKIKFSTNNYIN